MAHLQADLATLGLASDQLLPSIGALADDILSVPGSINTRSGLTSKQNNSLLVLALAGESELVLRLAIGDLVDP